MTDRELRILLVEDNPPDARLIGLMEQLPSAFRLERAARLSSGLELLASKSFDVALIDLSLPDSHGMAMLERIKQRKPDLPVVVLSGVDDEELAARAVRAGAQDYLVKGRVDSDGIGRSLRYAIERQRTEDALRVSEARNRALLDAIPDMMFRMDASGRYLDFKPSKDAPALPDELVNKTVGETFPDELAEQYQEHLRTAIETGKTQMFEYEQRVNGEVEHYETRLVASGKDEALAIVRNVTKSKRLEEQLRVSQRLEAVGRLAGGIAHDFNNLLTVISGNAVLGLMDFQDDVETRQTLEEISEAADRAANLTRQLLAFSRKQVIKPVPLDLNAMVQATQTMLRRLIGEDIALVSTLESGLDTIKADPAQIEQILMNLAVNARDAMPQGGKLIFETENVDVYETHIGQRMELRSGAYVMLAVSDTGVGMDAETRAKVFEPFFTTKERGRGTGLGLSTVYGIVKQSDGYIWVYSEPGMGTTVKIYFPPVQSEATVPLLRDAETSDRGHGETILLVEDDEKVLGVAQRFLDNGSYRVIAAAEIADALDIVNNHPGPIHLLATDVVMPGMNGRELAEELQSIRPDMKILYLSGYTDDAIAHHGVLEPGVEFLEKPYSRPKLLSAVRRALDA